MPFNSPDKQDEATRKISKTLERYLINLAGELGKILAGAVDKNSEAAKNLAIAFPDMNKSEVPSSLDVEVAHRTMAFSRRNIPAAYEIYTEASVCASGSDQELFPFKLKIELIPFKDDLYELSQKIETIRKRFDEKKSTSDTATRRHREHLEAELSWCEDLFNKIGNAREMFQGNDEKNDELKQVVSLLKERLDALEVELIGETNE
ncbi:MAG TPA: hypothetical protein PKV75_10295 [Desulfobacterales bacterium]|nr:hypothetical protein [Desulfobacterales bacterium]